MISTLRHQEIFDPKKYDFGITIIGAGAIGSRVFATLVELGLENITVYDFDNVEAHNIANQQFFDGHVGMPKADALKNWAQCKLGEVPERMRFINEKVEHAEQVRGDVFLLVDSLESRKHLAANALHLNPHVTRAFDVRMAASHGNVFSFNPHTQIDEYLRTLGDDEHAEVSACGSPFSVAPTAAALANLAVWQFILYCTDPAAIDERTNMYFKPFTLGTSRL